MFNSSSNESLSERGCNPKGNFSVIVHGWLESWKTEWVQDLISNLTVYRGGCIIFMDYSNYSLNPNYFLLVMQYDGISAVLLRFLRQMDGEGFDFSGGYMFGFSFGAHLAINTARNLGEKRFNDIDGECKALEFHTEYENLISEYFPPCHDPVCDPAGPGFEGRNLGDYSLAAQNVQCIHTSNNYGTMKRNCTQNWCMGVCGYAQVGAGPFPKGSHGLCPYYYTASFKHNFIAWENIYGCQTTRAVSDYPEDFKMGYMETRKG